MERAGPRSLVMDLEVGECLMVIPDPTGDPADRVVRVEMLAKSGKRTRIRVLAAASTHVQRETKQEFPAPA
jgi:hypothetical protein